MSHIRAYQSLCLIHNNGWDATLKLGGFKDFKHQSQGDKILTESLSGFLMVAPYSRKHGQPLPQHLLRPKQGAHL